jgi:hypothetical protein
MILELYPALHSGDEYIFANDNCFIKYKKINITYYCVSVCIYI